jgi:uncharacterized protein YxeA
MKKIFVLLCLLFLCVTVWFVFNKREPYSDAKSVKKLKVGYKTTEPLKTKPVDKISYEHNDSALKKNGSDVVKVEKEKLKRLSPRERNKLYNKFLQMKPSVLFNKWVDLMASSTKDFTQIGLLNRALAYQLQRHGSEDDFSIIAEYFLDSSQPLENRFQLCKILGHAATPETLKILLDFNINPAEPELKFETLKQIISTADNRWEGRFHEELSPLYEQEWNTNLDNLKYATAIALGIAKIGSPDGVELLLSEIINASKSTHDLAYQNDIKVQAALLAINKIRNPRAIMVLSRGLRDQDYDDVELVICGTSLSAMGLPGATQALLTWARNAHENVTPLAKKWFSRVRDTKSLQVINKFLNENYSFENESILEFLNENYSFENEGIGILEEMPILKDSID